MSRMPTWDQLGGADLLARTVSTRRSVTLAVALIGCAVCALSGGPILLLSLGAAIGLVLGRWKGQPSPRSDARWRVLNTSALIVCVLAAFAKVPLLVVGTGLVGWLQVHRAWTGRGARDDRVALLLALLQSLLGCIVTVSILLAPLFLALSVLAPVGLALCHLGLESEAARARRQRPGGSARGPKGMIWSLGPASAALTLVFFIGLPRLDGGGRLAVDEPERITGFGDDVDIGDLGKLLGSDAPVMRVRVYDRDDQPWTGPLYLRGAALDAFDGHRWTSTVGRGGRWQPPSSQRAGVLRQEILLEPISEKVIFGLNEVVGVRGTGRELQRDANGTLRHIGEPARLEYTTYSLPPETDPVRLSAVRPDPRRAARSPGELRAADAGAWTQLPPDLDPRIPALAARITAAAGPGASAYEQAVTIAAFLQQQYSYSLSPPEPEDGQPPADPLAWFLFDARQGHCEYFATALAVMLRSQQIPARVVNGFLGGEYNPLGGWVLVRQRDAHSWVEINLGAHGWVTMDATPAGGQAIEVASAWSQAGDWLTRRWHGAVLDYELTDQLGALAAIGRVVAPPGGSGLGGVELPEVGGMIAVGLLAGLSAALVRIGLSWFSRAPTPRTRPSGRVDRLHARAWSWVRRRGWRPPANLPPVEAARWLQEQAGPSAAPLERLAWLRYQVRYGGADDAGTAVAAAAAWQQLRGGGLPRPGEASQDETAKGTATD